MKQITVISGKGGTGKTTLTACLATIATDVVLADCDVDAADLHLLLHPKKGVPQDFYAGKGYRIDLKKCTGCGTCREVCRFGAISDTFVIDPVACDGCGACLYACPAKAIEEHENLAGEFYISSIHEGVTPFVHAQMHVAEDNSGKLVSKVRTEAKRLAELVSASHIIIDGPPGIGCPVNAAITGVDLALVVTEPTLSGMHDLERILDVTRHFKVPSAVVINKFDINTDNAQKIEAICREREVPCLARIPYSKAVVDALVAGKTILETDPEHEISCTITSIWRSIR